MPPVQPSIALESYLENVGAQLAEVTVTKLKNNFSRNEITALKELKNSSAFNFKKVDKGTTTVIMSETEKIEEAKVQLDNRVHYKPLRLPIVKKTRRKGLINIWTNASRKTNWWHDLEIAFTNSQSARTPIFYTPTKIHKPTPTLYRSVDL